MIDHFKNYLPEYHFGLEPQLDKSSYKVQDRVFVALLFPMKVNVFETQLHTLNQLMYPNHAYK